MKRLENGYLNRRDIVCGGGTLTLVSLLGSLLGGAEPVRAQPAIGAVPEIDRLAVRVVIDSYQIAIAPSSKNGNVSIERFGWALSEAPPAKALISEFGLSLHAESRRGDEVRNILIDFGFTASALNNNLELLRIDPAALDAGGRGPERRRHVRQPAQELRQGRQGRGGHGAFSSYIARAKSSTSATMPIDVG